jgi:hypothetical protein
MRLIYLIIQTEEQEIPLRIDVATSRPFETIHLAKDGRKSTFR